MRWIAFAVVVVLFLVTRFNAAAQAPPTGMELQTAVTVCNALLPDYDAATYCLIEHSVQYAASIDQQLTDFVPALPFLGIVGVAGVGFAIGSAVVPR